MIRIRRTIAAITTALTDRWAQATAASENGTAYIEYVVLGAVALIALLGVIQAFFGGISNLFSRLTDMINGI
jgi:Flp pilus assembly pilin Flp